MRPLDGLPGLEPWQNPNPSLPWALIPYEMREEKNVFLY